MSKQSIKSKLIAAFAAAGISASAAYVAYDLTYPSEGLVQEVYLDSVGLPTVCIGRMDRSFNLGETFSLEECLEMFAGDWKKHEKQLDSAVHVPYASEWQRAALTDFTFNVGAGNVKSSTLIRLVNQSRHVEACRQLTRWVYAGGRVLNGLVKRRQNTMPYCLGEIPWDKQQAYEEFLQEYNRVQEEQRNEDSN